MIKYTKPKAILFDWDNTLADTWPIIHQAMHDALTAMGQEPWTLEDTKVRVHRSLRDAFPPLFGTRWEEARDIYFKSFLSNHIEKLEVLEEAEDVLKRIKKAGVPMAVVSNKTGKYLREEVDHLKWNDYFGAIIGATDAKEDKPAAAPVHLALEKLGFKAGADIWLVGDSVTDLDCAFNAGVTPVFYGDRPVPSDYAKDLPERATLLPSLHHAPNHSAFLKLLNEVGL